MIKERTVLAVYFDKNKLLANGDRWEREIARSLAQDAPYR